jgi:hypothetical protein
MGKSKKKGVVVVKSKKHGNKKRVEEVILKGRGSYATSAAKAYRKMVPSSTRRLVKNRGTSLLNSGISRAFSAADVLLGSGNYNVATNKRSISYNSLFHNKVSGTTCTLPEFGAQSGVRFSRTEYVADVIAQASTPSTFSLQTYVLNPSQPGTLPWASQLACNFRQFRVHGMVWQYRSRSGAYTSSSTALGEVIMCEQMNYNDPAFVNKYEMENYYGAISVSPDQNAMCGIECDPKLLQQTGRYFTGNALDYQHVLGIFSIATNAIPVGNTICGELWVSYDIEFFDPILAGATGVSCGNYLHVIGASGNHSGTAPFGTVAGSCNTWGLLNGITAGSSLAMQLNTANVEQFYLGSLGAGNTLQAMPPGSCWIIMYQMNYSQSEALYAPTWTPIANTTAINVFDDLTTSSCYNAGTSSQQFCFYAFQMTPTVAGGVATLQLSLSSFTSTDFTDWEVFLFPIPQTNS